MRLRDRDLTWHVAGDDVVVLDLQGSVYLQLNGSARVLWECLAATSTEAELRAALIERYGLDEQQAATDVGGFLDDLRRRRLLED